MRVRPADGYSADCAAASAIASARAAEGVRYVVAAASGGRVAGAFSAWSYPARPGRSGLSSRPADADRQRDPVGDESRVLRQREQVRCTSIGTPLAPYGGAGKLASSHGDS